MRKSFLTVVSAAILLFFGGRDAPSQQSPVAEQPRVAEQPGVAEPRVGELRVAESRLAESRVAERDAEWNHYVLPQSMFVRQTVPDIALVFQVPSEWKRQQTDNLNLPDKTTSSGSDKPDSSGPKRLNFSRPNGVTLGVIIQKIPDGITVRDLASAMIQPLRSLPDGGDSMVVRRTTMAALEAREIMFESSAGSEGVTRRLIWTTVSGPNSVSLVLIAPIANVAEIEPYFKAVVQSVTFIDQHEYPGFDVLRSMAIRDEVPTRVDEVQKLAASFTMLDGSARQSNITRLASIFASSPGMAIDLVLDARPMVRAAAFEAIAQSHNNTLEKFLLKALQDRELVVAEKAARSVARNAEVIDLLRDQSLGWFNIESLARVWPFLNRSNQIKIVQEIFSQPIVPTSPARTTHSPATTGGTDKTRPQQKSETSPGKPRVTVRATVVPPGSPPSPVVIAALATTSDPSLQLHALTLIKDLPPSEFKLPLATILAVKNDALTRAALQVAWERHELLPVAELLKLLSSSSCEVRWLAMLHLGQSGSEADIKSIEGSVGVYLAKPVKASDSTTSVGANPSKPTDFNLSPDDVQLTISKIRLRQQLSTASGDARLELIKKGLADPKLAEWVWYRFVKENVDSERPDTDSKSQPASRVKVLPLGENLFPKDVTYYAALPQPATALDKLGSAIDGLQLESARSQANLVLIQSFFREQLARQLDSPSGTSPIVYSGINIKEPIALAAWYAEGATSGIPSAERRAIIFRVTDRARFERSLTLYQRSIGNFRELTDYFSGGVRFLTVLPAFIPLSAKAVLDRALTPPKETPLLKYSFIGETEWNGYSIKVVEQRRVESSGRITRDAAYLTYVGDTAVLTPDLDSLRDVLTRASSGKETLATNPNFKRLIENSGGNPGESSGEAIYLSNLTQLFPKPTDKKVSQSKGVVTESGALKISNSTWENLYQVQFSQSDWLKPFIKFQPEELASPRELLPRTTVAYFFMNFDAVAGWRDWSPQLFSAQERKDLTSIWTIDFEKEVLPELGPEGGIAVLGLPDLLGDNWELPWAAFFKLKSDKLAKALEAGKLLTGTSATTHESTSTPTHIKLKSGDLFAMVKGNFLVLSNNRLGIAALDHKEKLSTSRDFSRAAQRAPAGVVAFGGYNLEAAISAIGDLGTDSVKSQQSAFISSLANAFHSPNFYATATNDAVQGRFSLSLDREGRFSVSELSSLSKEYRVSYAQVEARGVPIQNQERLSSLKLRMRAKAAGEIDRIKEDISSRYQIAEKTSDKEMELRVLPRHSEPKASLVLPIKSSEFAAYLQPSTEIRSDDKSVIEKAQGIAGEERDAWKVARKLADWTYKNITWKQVDYATAPQTLATLEADCLEFSQLYVAMARSLGLPARIVSGLAYSGTAFGGHAWVEVYVGEWIEVDPTWGTDFVDATHIRDSANGSLMTYSALNLVELEVLEAPRGMAEFQKDPRALAEKLCEELPKGSSAALISALDLALMTNENLGLGTWESLSDSERDVMSSAYRRVLMDIGSFSRMTEADEWRLLKVKESDERAEAVVLATDYNGLLLKLSLVRRNGGWFLTEILQADTDLHVISEILQPTFRTIVDRRKNNAARSQGTSEFVRVLLVGQRDPKASIVIADRALKEDPKNRGLRHLKALALSRSENQEEAIQLWKELASESKPFAPAFLYLARQHDDSEDKTKTKLAIEFYTRYGELEPEDPRTHIALASLYEYSDNDVLAEAEYRAALKSDPSNTEVFVDLAAFLARKKRFEDAGLVIDDADKKASADDDLFGGLMSRLYFTEDKTIPEELARSQPRRMQKSPVANLYLAYVHLENGNSPQAIPLLKKAAALKKWAEPYGAMASAYRRLRNWTAALNAADTAVKIDAKYSKGHFERACALARLGRIREALTSLEKAVELDDDLADTIGEEADLKVLASKPAFKKLLPVPEPKQ